MMVNPTEQQTETYNAVLEAHEAGIDKLRAGVKLADGKNYFEKLFLRKFFSIPSSEE